MVQQSLCETRVVKLQNSLAKNDIDLAVLLKPQNVAYLTGFNPVIQSHPVMVVIPKQGQLIMLVSALRIAHAEKDSFVPSEQMVLYGNWGSRRGIAKTALEALVKVVKERGLAAKTVGVEYDHLPLQYSQQLEDLFPQAKFNDVSFLLAQQRMIKDEAEINLIRQAACIADGGMETALQFMKPGNTEIEVAVRTMQALQEAWLTNFPGTEAVDFGTPEGGCLNSLWCYCLSGQRMNYFAEISTDKVIEPGELTLSIIWTAMQGYHAENERTVAMKPVAPEAAKAFDTILEARAKAADYLRPGYSCQDVYAAATGVMKRHGYQDMLPGRVGHGIGLGAHEYPSLGPGVEIEFVPGMVFSFEPSLRIGSLGGIQHSDTVLITEKGPEFLTHSPRGFLQA